MKIRSVEHAPSHYLPDEYVVTVFRDDWNLAGRTERDKLVGQRLRCAHSAEVWPIVGRNESTGQLRIHINCQMRLPPVVGQKVHLY